MKLRNEILIYVDRVVVNNWFEGPELITQKVTFIGMFRLWLESSSVIFISKISKDVSKILDI